jgi:hypothetical protein
MSGTLDPVGAITAALMRAASSGDPVLKSDLAEMVGLRLESIAFGLAFQKAQDALREQGMCEFGPVYRMPGLYAMKTGKAALRRSLRFRRAAARKLTRASQQLGMIDASTLDEDDKRALETAREKTGAMAAFVALQKHRKSNTPG